MRILAALTVCLVGLLLGACATEPTPLPEADLDIMVVGDYDQVRPVRVVVAPVEAEASLGAPLDEIRESFYRMLIERRYAPFRLDLDSAAIPEDSARGTLAILIREWDRSRLRDRGRILVSGEVTLLRGGRALWKATFASLSLRAMKDDVILSEAQKDRLAAAALGARVLLELPAKATE